MAVGTGYSKIASSGLVFAYDTGDTYNSYLGRPTTNVIANTSLLIYNNVPGSVSSTLTATSETYRGATVWRQDLTALDGSGAGWLSNGSNPGIGVYTGGGGGNANQYSGHTIFFKPTVPMSGCPCYTNYSNIGGWQSSCNIENMGDGWYRAYVLWYNTITQGDGKFWAINPLSTSVGQTVTIYWAGPFREDLNSTTISQFVNGTRSTSQAIIDVGAYSTITPNNGPFSSPAINPQLNFDGTDDYLNTGKTASQLEMYDTSYTAECVCYPTSFSSDRTMFGTDQTALRQGLHLVFRSGQIYMGHYSSDYGAGNGTLNAWNHITYRFNASTGAASIFKNGVLQGTGTISSFIGTTNILIGRWAGTYNFAGSINVAKIYNRALSDQDILSNFNHYKTRFNIT
jgi:hypothetical protein